MRKTKIICTLGPSTDNPNTMKQLMREGMNVARFNFSHGTHQEHLDRLKMVQRCRTELGLWVATMLDTKGPEIRVGLFKDGPIYLEQGDLFVLTTEEIEGTKEKAHVRYKDFPRDVKVGTRVLFDDGLIESIVEEINGEEVSVRIMNGGKLSNTKGVNVPDVKLSMPFVSEKDRNDIIFAIENEFLTGTEIVIDGGWTIQ